MLILLQIQIVSSCQICLVISTGSYERESFSFLDSSALGLFACLILISLWLVKSFDSVVVTLDPQRIC